MKIGWIGLGKVGLPMALALAYMGGNDVVGYDLSPWPWNVLSGKEPPPAEDGLAKLLAKHRARDAAERAQLVLAGGPTAVVDHADVVFACVQTPHPTHLDGTSLLPDQPADFDYTALRAAVDRLVDIMAARRPDRHFTIVVVSTVAPGTLDRLPATRPANVTLAYSPSFISLGSVIEGFTDPPFVLVGAPDPESGKGVATRLAEAYYPFMPDAPQRMRVMSLVSAEMTKLVCNNYQTMKITWANEVASLCAATGADVDAVLGALAQSGPIGAPTMRAGLGDGGPCRVRDAVVLDWLTRQNGMGSTIFGDLLWRREDHMLRVATLARAYATTAGLDVVVLGRAYKPGTGLTHGSPAILLAKVLSPDGQPVESFDPFDNDDPGWLGAQPRVFVVGTNHLIFRRLDYPAGSIIIDPWGDFPMTLPGVRVIRYGRRNAEPEVTQ